MDTKTCSKCRVEKPLDQFYARKGGSGGVRADCRQCGELRRKAYQAAHPGAAAKRTAEWRKNNPERAAAASAKWIKEHPEKAAGYQAAWYAKNKERPDFVSGKWARENPELARAATTAYRKANLKKYSAYALKWVKEHPAQDAARAAKRRARTKNATPAWANKFFIDEIYDLARRRAKATGIEWHVDHIIPLNHPLVQGLHCEANLQVIPSIANITKGNRHWPDMP